MTIQRMELTKEGIFMSKTPPPSRMRKFVRGKEGGMQETVYVHSLAGVDGKDKIRLVGGYPRAQ